VRQLLGLLKDIKKMADHLKPTITSTYSNFVTELDGRFDDLAVGLDPAVTTATNVPTGSIRWVSASNKWQKYNGTAYLDLSSLYSINIAGNSGTVSNGIYTTVAYANPTWITALSGTKITGDISGNSASATKLFTARNINGVAFDGTASIALSLNNTIAFNNAGTGSASGIAFNGGTATTVSYNTIGAPSVTGAGASGSWAISVTGSSASLTTSRTINGTSFNGTADITTDVWGQSRTITIGGVGKALNGSVDVAWTVGEILPVTTSLSIANLNTSGNITATGTISASSDETLKTNWRQLPDNFAYKLSQVKYGIYDRIDTGQTQVGVSAQSLQTLLPDTVSLDNNQKLTVAYGNAALVAVIELAKEIEMLKQEIKSMKGTK
jgi:hypothetical protein